MSNEKVTLDKAVGNLGRIVQQGKELAREERRPPTPPPSTPKEQPTPTEQPPRT